MNPSPKTINDSAHFKVFAPTATRRLIDRARKSIAREERLGERAEFEDAHQPPLDDDGARAIEQAMQVARLGKAMHEPEVDDPRADRIIKLKNGGLTNKEIVEAAGVDVSAVKRDWRAARLSRLSIGIETGLNRTRRDSPAKFFSHQ
ncbi:MAG TPA: ECF-type sigma factor [Blastocatellia bacterium]